MTAYQYLPSITNDYKSLLGETDIEISVNGYYMSAADNNHPSTLVA